MTPTSVRLAFNSLLAGVLFAFPAFGAPPQLNLHIDIQTTGDVSVTYVPHARVPGLVEAIGAAFGCPVPSERPEERFFRFECPGLVPRKGLSRAIEIDLSPVMTRLGKQGRLELAVSYPRLGFAESSLAEDFGDSPRRMFKRAIVTARDKGAWTLRVRFGWTPGQVRGIFAWLLAAWLVLAAAIVFVCRRELRHIAGSLFFLGASLWLALVWITGAGEPLRLRLGSGVALDFALIALEFLLPLAAVAAGLLPGRSDSQPGLLWFNAMVAIPLACFVTGTPYIVDGQWLRSAPWLAAAFASVVLMRRRLRKAAGRETVEVTEGPLHDRIAALAARAHHPGTRLYVSFSDGPQAANAFAFFGGAIVVNAAAIDLFPKPELDAIVAHEISHLQHQPHAPWAALALASIAYHTAIADLIGSLTGTQAALVAAILVLFFGSLYMARKREFAADEGGVQLNGDPRSFIRALARLARSHGLPLELGTVAEWFSTHPSTRRRVEAIARRNGLSPAETGLLLAEQTEGETYELPRTDSTVLYGAQWQDWNGVRYAWGILCAVPLAAVLSALLVWALPWPPAFSAAAGIALGCALAKLMLAGVMAWGYKSLERGLRLKLGAKGDLTGLAPGDSVRAFGGQRYCDAGLLSFEGGRLCYRSERITIELNAGDIVEVGLLPASPTAWLRDQPMVRFRHPGTGELAAFILHPLAFVRSGPALRRAIDRWKSAAAGAATPPSVVEGLRDCAGEAFALVSLPELLKGFRVPGSLALLGGFLVGWPYREAGPPVPLVLAIAIAAYAALFLPYYLYRTPAPAATSSLTAASQ